MADDALTEIQDADRAIEGVEKRTAALAVSANGFASAMTRAFSQSVTGGKQFDDVLRSLGLRLSSMVVSSAFKPIANSVAGGISGGLEKVFAGIAGTSVAAAAGGIKPFAAGGVIGTPSYFPMMNGGVGLAGEAGPEAILPLARGADGQLGVTAPGARGASSITIHIATPDPESFRRSESYITGQIARAVARGQRSL